MKEKKKINQELLDALLDERNEDFLKLLREHSGDINIVDEFENNILHVAVLNKNSKIINELVKRFSYNSEFLNHKNTDGCTPLYYALRFNDSENVESLIKKCNDVGLIDNLGNTYFHLAVESGNKEILKMLSKAKTNKEKLTEIINHKTLDGKSNTALHIASTYNNLDVIRILVENGASLESRDIDGKSPIHIALEEKHSSIVQYFLEKSQDFNINMQDNRKRTLLHLAMNNGDTDIIKKLISLGADCNIKNDSGMTPLHCLSNLKDPDIVDLLLSQKGLSLDSVNSQDKFGRTPLFYAVMGDSPEVVEKLISHKVDINHEDKEGRKPIHYASRNGSGSIVDLLRENGANIMEQDLTKKTPLILAQENYTNLNVTDILLKNGADVELGDEFGNTPLYYAVKICINNNPPQISKTHAPEYEEKKLREVLSLFNKQDNDADIDKKVDISNFLIHLKNISNVRNLLNKNAYPDGANNDGLTPLHQAVFNNDKYLTRLLLQNHANVNVKDITGITPLHIATANARKNSENRFALPDNTVSTILLRNGSDVNASMKYLHITPLHLASLDGNTELLESLLNFGADINKKTLEVNGRAFSALDFAIASGNKESISMLIAKGIDLSGFDKNLYQGKNFYQTIRKMQEYFIKPVDISSNMIDENSGTLLSVDNIQDFRTLVNKHIFNKELPKELNYLAIQNELTRDLSKNVAEINNERKKESNNISFIEKELKRQGTIKVAIDNYKKASNSNDFSVFERNENEEIKKVALIYSKEELNTYRDEKMIKDDMFLEGFNVLKKENLLDPQLFMEAYKNNEKTTTESFDKDKLEKYLNIEQVLNQYKSNGEKLKPNNKSKSQINYISKYQEANKVLEIYKKVIDRKPPKNGDYDKLEKLLDQKRKKTYENFTKFKYLKYQVKDKLPVKLKKFNNKITYKISKVNYNVKRFFDDADKRDFYKIVQNTHSDILNSAFIQALKHEDKKLIKTIARYSNYDVLKAKDINGDNVLAVAVKRNLSDDNEKSRDIVKYLLSQTFEKTKSGKYQDKYGIINEKNMGVEPLYYAKKYLDGTQPSYDGLTVAEILMLNGAKCLHPTSINAKYGVEGVTQSMVAAGRGDHLLVKELADRIQETIKRNDIAETRLVGNGLETTDNMGFNALSYARGAHEIGRLNSWWYGMEPASYKNIELLYNNVYQVKEQSVPKENWLRLGSRIANMLGKESYDLGKGALGNFANKYI